MRFAVLFLSLLLMLPAVGTDECTSFENPVGGAVVSKFAPTGRYSGHWGVDLFSDVDTPVRSAYQGVVTFAGVVAGNRTVTVDHGGGLRTSYSFLSELSVAQGSWVEKGQAIGLTGSAHDGTLHFSVRILSAYQDPARFLGCMKLAPADGLRLVR